jgi:hypothetical protein
MPPIDPATEEHELPSVEAVLAGTLALMTGHSQALQADVHPENRLLMGAKIGRNLALLVDHPLLSDGFRQVLAGLQQRWLLMTACNAEAGRASGGVTATPLSAALH